jgi:hypothetical protein
VADRRGGRALAIANGQPVLGLAAVAGALLLQAALLALHLLQPGLHPRDEAVSYYVHGRGGWLLTAGLLAWGLGALALRQALGGRVGGRWAGAGRGLLGVFGVGVLLGAVFPADPPGHWDAWPSLAGMIHGNAALLAFAALPLSAMALTRSLREDSSSSRASGTVEVLAWACAAAFVLFMASLVPVFVRPGPPVLLGFAERLLLVVYSAWLAAAGAGAAARHGA